MTFVSFFRKVDALQVEIDSLAESVRFRKQVLKEKGYV